MTEPNRSKEASGATQAGSTANREQLPELSQRIGLSVSEAADAVGVSERHLRKLLPEIPHMHIGGRVVIPVKEFEAWLGEQVKAESVEPDRIVDEILDKFDLE